MSVATVKKMGLFNIQLFGFSMMCIIFAIIAASYQHIKDSTAGFIGGALGVFVLAHMLDDKSIGTKDLRFQYIAILCSGVALLGVFKPIDWTGRDEDEPVSPTTSNM
eukprot:gene14259-5585_t